MTDSATQRRTLYASLRTRNRIVAILRVGIPALGVLVFMAFAVQIFIASLASQFGIGQVHFNGQTVAVDTPSYSGVMADGDVYRISAQGAQTAVTNLNLIGLKNGVLTLTKRDGTVLTAHAQASTFDTVTQILNVPGTADVKDSTGNAGTLQRIVVDVPHQLLKAAGPVHLALKDGTTLDAASLVYDSRAGTWTFGRSTLSVPDATDDAGATP